MLLCWSGGVAGSARWCQHVFGNVAKPQYIKAVVDRALPGREIHINGSLWGRQKALVRDAARAALQAVLADKPSGNT